jgi:hypothetical protein
MFRFGVNHCRAVGTSGELPVELFNQVMLQRQLGRRGDANADDRENDDLPNQQPEPK